MEKEHSAMVKKHLAEMAKTMGGDHMHIHEHEEGYTSHHVHEGKTPVGPHEHATMGALKKHVADCMDGECESCR